MATCIAPAFLGVIVLLTGLQPSNALFEDQIGKFDWRHQYVGNVKFSAFEQSKHKRQIYVATESNVLASINLAGQLNWRHILQRGQQGVINSMLYSSADAGIVTLSGRGRLLRLWNATTGYLKWESPVSPEAAAVSSSGATAMQVNSESKNVIVAVKNHVFSYAFKSGRRAWTYADQDSESLDFQWTHFSKDEPDSPVYVIGVVEGSHFVIAALDAQSGDLINQTPVSAVWASRAPNCIVVSGGHFVCSEPSSGTLQYLTIGEQSSFSATSPAGLGLVQLSEQKLSISELFPSASGPSVFILQLSSDHHALLEVKGQNVLLYKDLPKVTAVSGTVVGERYAINTASSNNEVIELRSSYLEEGAEELYSNDVVLPGSHGLADQICVDIYELRDKTISGRVFIKTADEAISLVVGGEKEVLWLRDESLASAVSIELVDLPVSDTEARFEDEFGGKQGENIFNMFAKRLATQFAQFQSYVTHLKKKIENLHDSHTGDHKVDAAITHASQRLLNEDDNEEDDDEDYLTRDEFNLHKVVVIATKSGKIFGLDSKDGTIVWDHFLPNLAPFETSGKLSMPLFVQRTTAHFPNPPQCNLVGKNMMTGQAISFTFNPITGKPTSDSSSLGTELPYKVKQVTMLNLMTDQFLKVMLYLDTEYNVHVVPSSAASLVQEHSSSIYLFTADTDSGKLAGYRLAPSSGIATSDLEAEVVWDVQLPTSLQKITHVVGKRYIEHVHSQGRVLGDRSVLYKYLNPNLVAVVTEGEEIGSKPHVSVYLIDMITGAIIFSADHKKVQGPVHIVHTENWVVYQYWNQRLRRNEITVLELFEGKEQKNSTLFSSLDPPNLPLVERQSYVLPSGLQAMSATFTERGITARHILMSLASGGLLSFPKRFLDPRRPTELKPEHKEEGLIPYLPELPIAHQSMINYNQSIFGVTGIQTAPAGLESTCLVLTYGLDYYFTRVMPSNLFDVLKEDFDYMFILMVLSGLVVAALSTRRLASLKALRQAWR
ncbi:ER membrane protein complex subunit 1 [Strongylocentrotus purpuratus]|uniref:ER membrane protein complex subunit 1 n=1 Tax=Strongylocentrotus purpuratus TaxID=7668 RepID=A0A7M7NXZ4_STRPU|nr:ER membrane protein complex subunit 1 [Strongylocentrotus purpuratus]